MSIRKWLLATAVQCPREAPHAQLHGKPANARYERELPFRLLLGLSEAMRWFRATPTNGSKSDLQSTRPPWRGVNKLEDDRGGVAAYHRCLPWKKCRRNIGSADSVFSFRARAKRAILSSRQHLRRGKHMATATDHANENEVTILARILGNENGHLPKDVARYILDLHVSEPDKARMHDLVVRNQDDALTPAEKEEMHAYGKATTLLSILKSKARRTLGVKLETCATS